MNFFPFFDSFLQRKAFVSGNKYILMSFRRKFLFCWFYWEYNPNHKDCSRIFASFIRPVFSSRNFFKRMSHGMLSFTLVNTKKSIMPTEHFTLRLQAYLELQEFPKVEWEPECWVISQTIQNCTFILQIKVQFWIVLGAAVGQEVEQPVRPLSSTHIIQGHLRAGACPSYYRGRERYSGSSAN